jgi:hypothetical protein
MNMISTGAFQNEMSASNNQPTLAEKFAAVWEKKNAKAARAGGVSLMALSLAACGSDSTTTTDTTADTPADTTTVTPVTPVAPVIDAAVVKALQISSTTGLYDDLAGGSGADTFIAGAGALETGDAVNGGAGADTISATYTASVTVMPSVSNVETVNVRAYGSNVDVVVDMDSISGATAIYSDRMDNVAAANAASTTFNNIVLGTGIGINGGAAAATSAGDVTFTFKLVTGASDSASLDLKGALVNDVTIAGIETVNIASGTSANLLADLVVANATKIVVTGSQNLTITGDVDMADNASTVASAIDGTVDASAFTGKLNFTPNASDNVSITGGSGDDTFAMTTGLDKNDVLDGGAGTDTASVTAQADDASLDLSTYGFTSIDTFQIEGAAGGAEDPVDLTIAADAAGVSKLVLVESQAHADGANTTDEGTFTVTGLSSGNTVTLVNNKVDATNAAQVSQIGAVTLSLLDGSATTDSLTVELAGTTGQTAAENTVDDLSVLNVETLNLVSTHTGTLTTSVLTATDDNTLGDLSTDALLTTLNISGSDQASITVGSEATKLATVDTTGMSNDLSLTLAGVADQTITGGAANETVAMGATLNNKDTVDLGAGAKDVLGATSTSTTATTGALSIANVETINLTNAGTSVIDATSITGASEIAVLTNTTSTTMTGLVAGTAIGLGHNATDGAVTGLFNIALADATGTADALTFNLNNTLAGNNAVELKATGIETVTLAQTSLTDTAMADYTFDVDSLNASKIVVTGAKTDVGNAVILTALDTDTTAVDATGFYGVLTTASGTAIATTYDVRGGVAGLSLTGSSKNDTFNVTTAMTNDDATIDGNGGTDTLTMALGTGAQDFDSITDVDTINFTATGTVAITTNATDAVDGINEATKVTFTGGNSISTVALGGNNDQLTDAVAAVIDMSGFLGALSDATWTVDDFDNVAGKAIQVIGTANKDTVSASYDGDSNPAVQLNTQGVEVFDVLLADSSTEVRIDMSLVTGMTTINVLDTSDERVEFYNMTAGTTIDVTATDSTNTTVEVVYADDTSATDSQTFIVAAASADDNVALVIDDIDTINISSDSAAQVDLTLASVSMTAATGRNTVNFTGTNDIELIATGADVTTINASGMGTGGALVQSGRTATEASTYTGSGGNDTLIMMHANDVIDGGAGTSDTLDINMTQAVGTAIIDMTAADQIASFNGGANAAVQTGFENLDISGLLTKGAVVTGTAAANTITGSALIDQIDAGAGNDTIVSSAGNDVITLGAGADVVQVATSGHGLRIKDFTVGTDDIDLNLALKSDDGTTVAAGAAGAYFVQTVAAGDNVFQTAGAGNGKDVIFELSHSSLVFTGNFATMTDAQLKAALVTELDSSTDMTTSSVGEIAVIFYDNQATANAAVMYIDQDGTKGTLATTEIAVLAVIEGVGANNLVATDFI